MSTSSLAPPQRYSLLMTALLSCLFPSAGSAETYDALPPPPAVTSGASNQQYMLGLVVNGRDNGDIVPVEFRDGHYLIRAGDLQRAGLPQEKLGAPQVDVSAMPEVKAEYDSQRQRILLTVPAGWLPAQTIDGETKGPRYPGRTSTGALINYDFYASRTESSGTRLSAWNEFRLFGDAGQFVSNGTWQQQLEGGAGTLDEGYLRYDTFWTNQDEADTLSWRAGDLVTDALSWSSSVRLGGLQIGRDFSLRPDLVTYPLPTFAGQASVPSTVDLFINGYRNSSNDVQPGPYSLTNMPFVNGAGNAVIVTTDAVGRQVTTTLPFYVSSNLLKPGLSDFSFAAGSIRENYGISNFDYGPAAVSGSYRYGATDWLTLETHAEGAESLALGGGGAQVKMGPLGVINGAVAQSQMSGQTGTQYSWGYQYNANWFSVGTQHTLRTSEFGDLALYGNRLGSTASSSYTLSRRSAQYNASISLDRYGSIGAAFIDITGGAGDRTRLWNLSWSKNIWGSSSLYISASRDQQQGDWTGAISLMIPFGEHGNASLSVERDQQGGATQRAWVSRSMPSDGGIAWDASWANQSTGGDYRQGSLNWRTQKMETSAGFYGSDDNTTEWADLSGALVLMDGGFFAANAVNDAFVLVKTGYPDVNVRYENQSMGKTDKQGYLLVPGISSYYPAKYDIDTLDLPADMTASRVEQRFAVKRQSGYLLNFPIETLRAASVVLHDQNGQPLPVSTQIMRPGQATEYVGWDGIVWMDNLAADNPIAALTPDGRRCETRLAIAGGQPKALNTYGPLICSLPPLPAGASSAPQTNTLSGNRP
ncbi:outer membrane usher protein [Erwinia toletana]|uniref:Outer membrane usher protein n=1 Tax=Winslowiella toletana TaxID=92490 RepID=A0ABS4P6P7_9GAMM|nr:outer membrane usher protein [Winslowiella toletana]